MMDERKSPECTLLQQFGYSGHKPCQALLKECDYENVPSAVQGKTRTDNKKVIVRSSYFQHKSVNKNGQDNKQERQIKDRVASDMCEDTILETAHDTRTVNENVSVRSSYFQHKSVSKNDQENKQERHIVKDDVTSDTCEDIIPESAHSKINYSDGITMKRKASLNDTVQRVGAFTVCVCFIFYFSTIFLISEPVNFFHCFRTT